MLDDVDDNRETDEDDEEEIADPLSHVMTGAGTPSARQSISTL